MQPKRRGVALTVIGAIVAFPVAIAVFIAAIVFGVQHFTQIIQDAPTVQSNSSLTLPAGTTVAVFTRGYDVDCTVTDPAGSDVSLDYGSSASINDYDLLGSFETTDAGSYGFDCDGAAKVVSGSDAKGVAKSVFTWIAVGIGLAGLVFVVGLVLLIIGIVKLVGSGRERREWQQQAAYAGGQPPAYGQQPFYGQQPYQGQQPPYGQQPYQGQQPPDGQHPGDGQQP